MARTEEVLNNKVSDLETTFDDANEGISNLKAVICAGQRRALAWREEARLNLRVQLLNKHLWHVQGLGLIKNTCNNHHSLNLS